MTSGARGHAGLGSLQRHDGPDLAGPADVVQLVRRLEGAGAHGPRGRGVHRVVAPDDGMAHSVHLVADGGDGGGAQVLPGRRGQVTQQLQPLERGAGPPGAPLSGVLKQRHGPLHPYSLLRSQVVSVHPGRVRLRARGLEVEAVVLVPPDDLLGVVPGVPVGFASIDLPGALLLRPELEEAECVLGAEEARDHGHDGAEGRADVGRLHQVVEAILVDVVLVSLAQEAAPLPHLEDQEIDEVDHGDHQGHQQQPLRLLHRQLAEAAEHDGDNSTEHVLEAKVYVSN